MTAPSIQKLIVIGGGLVGLATAYKYLQAFPSATLTVLEKESAPRPATIHP